MNQNIKTWRHREKTFKWSKSLIEYSAHMDDVHNNINNYNPPLSPQKKKIVFDEMTTDIMTNKKRQAIREED